MSTHTKLIPAAERVIHIEQLANEAFDFIRAPPHRCLRDGSSEYGNRQQQRYRTAAILSRLLVCLDRTEGLRVGLPWPTRPAILFIEPHIRLRPPQVVLYCHRPYE